MTLYDYIPQAQAAVEKPWLDRKLLVACFAARHSVLEYDAQDFTLLHLFMKVLALLFDRCSIFVAVWYSHQKGSSPPPRDRLVGEHMCFQRGDRLVL